MAGKQAAKQASDRSTASASVSAPRPRPRVEEADGSVHRGGLPRARQRLLVLGVEPLAARRLQQAWQQACSGEGVVGASGICHVFNWANPRCLSQAPEEIHCRRVCD